jgi:hypothetical protein
MESSPATGEKAADEDFPPKRKLRLKDERKISFVGFSKKICKGNFWGIIRKKLEKIVWGA